MKLFKYGLPFAALALLASCANDNIDQPNGGAPEAGVDGTMYMTATVALPTGAGTKAASLSGYEEGTETEYAVRDMTLYIFKLSQDNVSAKENPDEKAEYVGYANINFGNPTDKNTDVQKQYTATFQIGADVVNLDAQKKPADGAEYYGLLIVNQTNNTRFTAPSGSVNYLGWNKAQVMNVSDLGETFGKEAMITDNYFFMSNAPQAVKAQDDDTYSPQTLVYIDTQKFATSPAQATEKCATFFVQRGVAKLNLSTTEAGWSKVPVEIEYPAGTEATQKDVVDMKNWTIDNANLVTYPVQHVEKAAFTTWCTYPTSDNYFIASISGKNDLANHIWWAVDPNYDTNQTPNTFALSFKSIENVSAINFPLQAVGETEAHLSDYCLENTMATEWMNKKRTTRVVFEGIYKIKGEEWSEDYAGFAVYNDLAVKIKKADMNNEEQASSLSISLTDLINPEKLDDYKSDLLMGVNTANVAYYAGAKCYYTAYIRHFSDDETPLTSTQKESLWTLGDEANKYEAKQTGRYGVLRNNAYGVKVIAVAGYGSPIIPDDPDEPDDKEDPIKYNAKVEINVLNWAKRDSEYTLK